MIKKRMRMATSLLLALLMVVQTVAGDVGVRRVEAEEAGIQGAEGEVAAEDKAWEDVEEIPESHFDIGDKVVNPDAPATGTCSIIKYKDSANDKEAYDQAIVKLPSTITENGVTYTVTRIKGCSNPGSTGNAGKNAFYKKSLSAIYIPDTVTSIGPYAFNNCSNLSIVRLSTKLMDIGEYAFSNCDNLSFANLRIPDTLRSIGGHAFYSTTSGSVVLPRNVESVGEDAFYGAGTKELYIYNDNLEIGSSAFNPSLQYIYCNEGYKYWKNTTQLTVILSTSNPTTKFRHLADSISVDSSQVTGVEYELGKSFGASKLVITPQLANGSSTPATISFDDCEITIEGTNGLQLTKAGRNTVVVRYGRAIDKFDINVFYNLSTMSASVNAATYTGNPLTPIYTLTNGSTVLEEGETGDFVVKSISNNENAGTGTIVFEGRGKYRGTLSKNFTINKKNLSSCTIDAIPQETFNGAEIKPLVVVKDVDRNETLELSTTSDTKDYKLSYSNNVNANESSPNKGVVTVTGEGNYTGSITKSFDISKKDFTSNDVTVTGVVDREYDGNVYKPNALTVKDGISTISSAYYTVNYEDDNAKDVGTYQMYVSASVTSGNYKGVKTLEYKILPISIEGEKVKILQDEVAPYTGTNYLPKFKVTNVSTGSALVEGVDYKLEVEGEDDLCNAGSVPVTVVGMGNYAGSKEASFVIKPNVLAATTATVTGVEDVYPQTGEAVCPNVTVTQGGRDLLANVDYDISYSDNEDVGTGKFTITGKGNYSGTLEGEFLIRDASKYVSLSGVTVGNVAYTGQVAHPSIEVKVGDEVLQANKDYLVQYEPQVDVGTVSVTVVGQGEYYGEARTSFQVTPKGLDTLNIGVVNMQYTGGQIKPYDNTVITNTAVLAANTDYQVVAYSNNVNVGTASVEIKGIGNYTGSKTIEFAIVPAAVSSVDGFSVSSIAPQTSTGEAIVPKVEVYIGSKKLAENVDYTLSAENNVSSGTATLLVNGTGNYTGTKRVNFTIQAAPIDSATVGGIKDGIYFGGAVTQDVSVTLEGKALVPDKDYTVSYAANTGAGVASVIITGMGNYSGSLSRTFTIAPASLEGADMGGVGDAKYTGKPVLPNPSVNYAGAALVRDRDYVVGYASNVGVGTARVTVTGIGNYTGTISDTFGILPGKATLSSAKSAKKGTVAASWKKMPGASGYEVSIAKDSKFKKSNKKVTTAKSSYSFKKLKKGTYYVKVRAYLTRNGEKAYGTNSKTIKVRVKK